VQIFTAIRGLHLTCPSSQQEDAAAALARDMVATEHLRVSEEQRLAELLGYLHEMLLRDTLDAREAVGSA
jgi:hypothetical protein